MKAIEAADVVLASSGRHVFSLDTLAASHVENGELEEARAVYGEMRARARREPISSLGLAGVAAAVGECAAALDYARDAIRRHDPGVIVYARSWPQSRFLREMPEFQALLNSVGFPEWRS